MKVRANFRKIYVKSIKAMSGKIYPLSWNLNSIKYVVLFRHIYFNTFIIIKIIFKDNFQSITLQLH